MCLCLTGSAGHRPAAAAGPGAAHRLRGGGEEVKTGAAQDRAGDVSVGQRQQGGVGKRKWDAVYLAQIHSHAHTGTCTFP